MASIVLHVSRTTIAVQGPDRELDSTRALVALGIEGGRVGIVGVGEDEPTLVERFAKPATDAPLRGLRARIVAAAAADLPARTEVAVRRPGDDAFWDRIWQDPYAMRTADPSHARELLVIEPLSESSWSPHLVQGLLMYALWTSRSTRHKTWPAFRRPRIELRASDDLEGLHYEELVDQLRSLWGAARVELPPDRRVAPPPTTPLTLTARVSHAVFWAALAGSFVLPRGVGVVLAGLAVVAFLVRRVALARARVERPRRKGHG